jgi:hypothetical protein
MNKITFPLRLQIKGPEVADLQAALALLGSSIAKAEKTNQHFGPTTQAAVSEFQTSQKLPATGEVDAATADALNEVLADKGAFDPAPGGGDGPTPDLPTDDPPFSVQGEVVKPDGTPLPNLVVRAYDRALCEWRALGGAGVIVRTNDLGRYRITYDPLLLKQWGKTRADLKVEVLSATGDTVLAESALILQARPQETVNFSIGDRAYRGPDEFTRLERALLPLLHSRDDLSCVEVADVLILARDAGLRASLVAYYVKARRWAAEFGAPAGLFYALMRRGESLRIDELLARPLAGLWQTLQVARRNNIVNLPLDEATRTELAQLQLAFLNEPDHPLSMMLDTTPLSTEQRKVFTAHLTEGNTTGEAFWQALGKDAQFSTETVTDLQQAFELQALVVDNTSLTLRLRADFGVSAARDVAGYSIEQWRDTILTGESVEIPAEILPGGTPAERRAAYAQQLYRVAELRYPTPSLVGQMARDPAWEKNALPELLTVFPEFDLSNQRLLRLLSDQPGALDNFSDPNAARQELLRVEQLFHLVPAQDKLQIMQPLWTAGLRSAPQIAWLGRNNLRRQIGAGLDAKTVDQIYRNAVQVSAVALNAYLQYAPHQGSQSLPVLHAPQVSSDDAPAEWTELFGSPDACECSHCESALSPAAYLVDSMAFLERAVDSAGNNALDELLARRPDLGSLRLSCENTETPLPHIDVVIEILEAIVASPDGKTLPAGAIGETTWDSELLTAQPEHMQPAAYDVLRAAVYPFNHLPFDLWTEEGRRYLQQMGIARDALMQAMPRQAGVGALQIATETLGMTSLERDLIRQPDPRVAAVAAYWGVAAGPSAINALGRVTRLIERAQTDYDTLLRLLNTRYINADRTVVVSFGATPCLLDGAVLAYEDGAPFKDLTLRKFLDRLQRFMRLQRRLECSEYELDTLLALLGIADFNAALFIERLADLQSLRDTFGLPLLELCAWWGDLDTYAFEQDLPSQYEAIYLNDALFPSTHSGVGPDLRNGVFALRSDRADLVITTSTDASLSRWLAEQPDFVLQADYAGYIQSATRLSAHDLQLLVRDWLPKDPITGHVALNLANVSLLYRMASLVRALKIDANDALRLFALIGLAPLSTPAAPTDPSHARKFHDQFADIDAGDLTVEALAYLLLHDADAVTNLAPTSGDIDAWLAAMLPSFIGILAIEGSAGDATVTPELQSATAQSVAAAIDVDAALLESLLFTSRPELGMELLVHLIVAANPDQSGLPEPQGDFHALFIRLHKFALAWNGLELDELLLPYIVEPDKGPALGWIDIAALPVTVQVSAPFVSWSRLVDAAALQRSTFTTDQSLFAFLEQAAVATGAQTDDPTSFVLDGFLTQLADWTTWPVQDLVYLTGPDGFALDLPAAMRNEQALLDLQHVFDLLRARTASAEQAHTWTLAELGYSETQAIKQILSLRYSPSTWLEVLGSIQNPLREQKRDALLGHLLNTLGMADSDAFYARYLIDPDASACGQTSRIVSARLAVQLFVQRILFRLEPFTFQQADAEAWRWRENYRVWEAARKVFLWPENWLIPELRDNKSQFFRELEDALTQEEVTNESAGRIYADYLAKLDRVARLEILGLYEDTWIDNGVEYSALHVVGRTREVPASYFYRRLEDGLHWTPWEGIDLDLKGEHLVPVAYNGKLYLFAPEFKVTELDQPSAGTLAKNDTLAILEEIEDIQREIEATAKRIADIAGNVSRVGELPALHEQLVQLAEDLAAKQDNLEDSSSVDPDDAVETFRYEIELGMTWVTLDSRGSTGKYQARETLTYWCNVGPEYHQFVGWVSGESLLRIAVSTSHTTVPDIGYFYFDDAHGELFASKASAYPPRATVSAFGAERKFQALKLVYFYGEDPRLELEVQGGRFDSAFQVTNSEEIRLPVTRMNPSLRASTSLSTSPELATYPNPRPLLTRLIDGGGQVHYLHQQGSGGQANAPFIFSTNERCYFVTPQESSNVLDVWAPISASLARSAPGTAQRSQATVNQASNLEYGRTDVLYGSYNGVESDALNAEVNLVEHILMQDDSVVIVAGNEVLNTSIGYRFTRFYDPYTSLFLRQTSRHGVAGLLSPDAEWDDDSANLYRQLMPNETFSFLATYKPHTTWVDQPYPVQQIDFDHDSPCGWSNWELFFYIPMLIATRLMENQRYAEARQWLHHIFDPTSDDGDGPERFWKIRPFYEAQKNGALSELNTLLTTGSTALESQVKAWTEDPFSPFLIARMRTSTFMLDVVMRYLDCLLQEADLYFSLDTREFINKAQLLYMLAGQILGERPTLLPAQQQAASTPSLLLGRFRFEWKSLGGNGPLDPLASILTTTLPGVRSSRNNARTAPGPVAVDASVNMPALEGSAVVAQGGTGIVDTLLLFCIPHNEKLYTYWDTVADRLFKIRHCMNLSGQVRQLALFAPAIDPGLLVRASAAGLSITSVLSGLFGLQSPYRFTFLLQKALELCGEARSFAGALLAALEKKDGEALALMRSTHEIGLLEAIRGIKQRTVDEGLAALDSLKKSRESAETRAAYYSTLERVSRGEQTSIDKQDRARGWQIAAETTDAAASVLSLIPMTVSGTEGGLPTLTVEFGGPMLGAAAQATASGLRSRSAALSHQANRAATTASHTQRSKDWKLQADLAKREIQQLDKQILAAEIRVQIAETDLTNHDTQIDQAGQVEDFLKMKFTNQQLYGWMLSRVSSVHFQAYQMASQLAIQAEAAFQRELGPDQRSLTFIRHDNWDSLKKGLVAGDLLHQQLRQMESSYLAANQRELEITKHVSLFQLDPTALLTLRETGSCEIHIPEVLFDMDFAGHYFRRIKSASISIPCVVGPYTNVSATLTLTESWTRGNTDLSDPAQPDDATVVPQTAIATSSANQDGGMFELSFTDPRYLPFEGAGAISTWCLELPNAIRSFDYDTITDVIIHLSYSARDGGADLQEDGVTSFKQAVTDGLTSSLNDLKTLLVQSDVTLSRLFSLRQEFATEWNRLLFPGEGQAQSVTLKLNKRHFPKYLDQIWRDSSVEPITLSVDSAIVYLKPAPGHPIDPATVAFTVNDSAALASDPLGLIKFSALSGLTGNTIDSVAGLNVALTINDGPLLPEEWKDMYILLSYRVDAGA